MKLKSILGYLLIPLLIILSANLLGFAVIVIGPLLDRLSDIVNLIPGWLILLIFIAMVPVLGGTVSRIGCYSAFHHEAWSVDAQSRVGCIIRPITKLILLCYFVIILIVLCVLVYHFVTWLYRTALFTRFNTLFFLAIVLAVLQFSLRTDTFQELSWKKLSRIWMKPPVVSGITVGGFGFIATSDAIKNPLLRLTLESEYTNTALIISTTLIGVGFFVFAIITERVGRSNAPRDDDRSPAGWFYTTFAFAFVSNLCLLTSLLTSVFLTVHTHYTMHVLPDS